MKRHLLHAVLLMGCASEEAEEPFVSSHFELQVPAAGAWLPAGSLQASGLASGVDEVLVQGDPADLDAQAGAFSALAQLSRGLNIVEASATQFDGDLMFARHGALGGEFTEPGSTMADAASLRLNQPGLDDLMEMAENLIEAQDIATAVRDMGVLHEEDWSVVTLALELDEGDDALQISDLDLVALAGEGVLTVRANMDVYVRLRAYGTYLYFFDYDETITIYDTSAAATAAATVGAQDGELDIDVSLSEFLLDPFNYDVSLLPSEVVEWLTADLLAGIIEDMLLEQAEEMIPELVDSVLAELPEELSFELLGSELTIGYDFSQADIDADGLRVGLDVDVAASGASYPPGTGYLATEQELPSPERSDDASGSVADEVLNAALYEVWATGLFDMTISEESIEDEDMRQLVSTLLFDPLREQLNHHDVHLELSASLPPVIVGEGGDLKIQAGELALTIHTPDRALGSWVKLATFAELDATVSIEDGALDVDVLAVQYSVMARDSDWGASEEAITNLLAATMEELLGGPEAMAVMVEVILGQVLAEVPEIEVYGLRVSSAAITHSSQADASQLEIELEVGEYTGE